MPKEIKEPFELVSKDLIITDKNYNDEVKGLCIVADVELHNAGAFYRIDRRKTHFRDTKLVKGKFIVPDKKIYNQNWSFDAMVELNLFDFNFLMNMVRVIEEFI
jgi:hypothetical protein